MKTIFTLVLAAITSLSLFAQKETKVLFIGLDGVRSDALQLANTPNMDQLMSEGTFTFTSWNIGITVSGPSWSSMLTGVWPDKHGVTSNNYTSPNWNQYPYFVTRAKEVRPDIKAVQITTWAPMSDQVFNDGWDQKLVVAEDDDCVAAAQSLLLNDTTLDVLFVHIDDCDAAGHANGFDPNKATYINAIEYADVNVGQIMTALKNRPNFNNEDWIVMLTTDHGGIGNGHGGITREEREIWWIGWSNSGAFPVQELVVDLNNLSIQDYVLPNQDDFDEAPLLVDISVSAIDHLLPTVSGDSAAARWDLDGKSWLNKTLDSTTSVQNISLNVTSGKIYPNPTQGQFTLNMQNVKKDVSYRLYNTDGVEVTSGIKPYAGNALNIDLDITDQPAGIYLLEVTQGGISQVKRVVKQ